MIALQEASLPPLHITPVLLIPESVVWLTVVMCVCVYCCPQQADTSGQRLTLDDFLYDWPQFLKWGLSLNLDLRVHSTRLPSKPLYVSDPQHWG